MSETITIGPGARISLPAPPLGYIWAATASGGGPVYVGPGRLEAGAPNLLNISAGAQEVDAGTGAWNSGTTSAIIVLSETLAGSTATARNDLLAVNPGALGAIRAMLAGAEDTQVPIVIAGDSHVYGSYADGVIGAGDNPTLGQLGFVGRLRTMFATDYGDPGEGFIALAADETRRVDGGSIGSWFPAGCIMRNNRRFTLATHTQTVTIPTGKNLTRLEVWQYDLATSGPLRYTKNGGGSVDFAVSPNGTRGWFKETIAVTGGDVIVVSGPAAGGNLPIGGFSFRTASNVGVAVHRMGRSGYVSGDLLGGAWNGIIGLCNSGATQLTEAEQNNCIDSLYKWAGTKGLLILLVGTNDQTNQLSTTPATVNLSTPDLHEEIMRKVTVRATSQGWKVLMIGPCRAASENVQPGAAPLSAYKARQRGIALSNPNVAYFDIDDVWTSDVVAVANAGLRHSGSSHPMKPGHLDIARMIYRLLQRMPSGV